MGQSDLRILALLLVPGLAGAGSFTPLGDLPAGAFSSRATGVSADGTVVVGRGSSASGDEAFRWTGGVMTGLGDLPGGNFGGINSYATGVSADGAVVVGRGSIDQGEEAFRWTGGVMTGLGFLPSTIFYSDATDVSDDGAVVVGWGKINGDLIVAEAFRWTGGVMTGLGISPGYDSSYANGVSADGSVVVGSSEDYLGNRVAFRWIGGVMTELGDLPGGSYYSTSAADVSADGSVVVGQGFSNSGPEVFAFVWTQSNGMKRLVDVLVANGATGLTGWTLDSATAISADGQWIVGNGSNPNGLDEAFLANISLADLTPDTFFFLDQTGVPQSALITSAPVTISGITGPAPVTVANGQYSVGCGAAFTSAAGTIGDGQTICVRHRSAAPNSTLTSTVLSLGGVTDTFTSTTVAASGGGGGGGGGALDGFSLLALGLMGVIRRKVTV